MKLILTSNGLSSTSINKRFLDLLDKEPSKTKIFFVTSKTKRHKHWKYTLKSKRELLKLGVAGKNIKMFHLGRKIDYGSLLGFDAIYMCGGNTYLILKKTRESGFDTVIKKFVRSGRIYVGVSAGSIICGPNITTTIDPNSLRLKDLSGLRLIDVLISPHHSKEREHIFKKQNKKFRYPVVGIPDKHALIVTNREMKRI